MTLVIDTLSERQSSLAAAAVEYMSSTHADEASLDDAFGCTHDELAVIARKLRAGLTLTVDQRELAAAAVDLFTASAQRIAEIGADTRAEIEALLTSLRVA